MNRAQRTEVIAWLEGLADAATQEAKRYRDALKTEAHAEYIGNGGAPSWKMPDLATVSSKLSHDSVKVTDPAALLAWVAERHPEEVEQVVRPAYVKALRELGKPAGDKVTDPATGEVIPGLAFVPGGQFIGIEIRIEQDAKDLFGGLALEALHHAALVAPPSWADELRQLGASEPVGHLDPGEVPE